jgi:hypothetical protein
VKLSPRQKKWIKAMLILLAIRFVVGAILYYLIVYRFKDIAAYIVKKETKGVYTFDAARIDFSLFHHYLELHHITLTCQDTLPERAYYDVKIPKIYLSIISWKELLLHKKLVIDSFAILQPQVAMHQRSTRERKHANFDVSRVLEGLQQVLTHLQVRTLQLKDGAFTYHNINSTAPLVVNHFDLSITNFTKVTSADSHLLASDDVEISFRDQYWILPDGNHTLGFKRLHFSGKAQYFEMDSCILNIAATPDKGAMTLSADKFLFNSKHLPAIYMRDELLIDTLLCIRPVLTMPLITPDKQKKDTAAIANIAHELFKKIQFKYIDITDGEVLLKHPDNTTTTASAQKNNLKVFNLTILPSADNPITTDSIRFNLKDIRFYSLDSLFQIGIGEFTLQQHDIIFRNAEYAPTPNNHADKGFTFTAPVLRLNNIDLADLLRKKLRATSASLYQPSITFYDHRLSPKKGRLNSDTSSRNTAALYHTLHGLSELINVKDFHIVDGNVHYHASRGAPLTIGLKGLNADILLNHFFLSDSLVDIKHAVPKLQIKNLQVQSKEIQLQASDFTFNGIIRHNHIASFQVALANGIILKGKQMYWEVFDWDVYDKTREIQINVLHFDDLSLALSGTKKATTAPAKDLPVIRIGELAIRHFNFHQMANERLLQFNAHEIFLDNIYSHKQFIMWRNAMASLDTLTWKDKQMQVVIPKIKFNNKAATIITAVDMTWGGTKVFIPEISIKGNLQGTDPAQVRINSFGVDHANVVHQSVKGADTTRLSAQLQAQIMDLQPEGKTWAFNSADIALSAINFHHRQLDVQIPRSSLRLKKGHFKTGDLFVKANTLFKWEQGHINLQQTDTTGFTIAGLSGVFADPTFSYQQKTALAWQPFTRKTAFRGDSLQYKGKKVTVHTGAYNWQPDSSQLHLYQFEMMPNKSRDVTFSTEKWQQDYITVKGDALQLQGITFPQQPDTMMVIQKIVINRTALTAARDKRMPFEHGIEKLMPTKLIHTIPLPIQIDSILIQHSQVNVEECSKATNQWAIIPIEDINGVITNLRSRPGSNDSLTVMARGQLFNSAIRYFSYQESYGDSLSGFQAQHHIAPINLPNFSEVSVPMAAVRVRSGYADTVYANWWGNKYAAFGNMHFYYEGLKIQILDKKDFTRKRFLLSLESWVANLILRNNNHRPSLLFIERDREKFIFNYWVKAQAKGLLSSVGIKRDKKYLRQYRKIAARYHFPAR